MASSPSAHPVSSSNSSSLPSSLPVHSSSSHAPQGHSLPLVAPPIPPSRSPLLQQVNGTHARRQSSPATSAQAHPLAFHHGPSPSSPPSQLKSRLPLPTPPPSSHKSPPPPPPFLGGPMTPHSEAPLFAPLVKDRESVLMPDYLTPFVDARDVVARLLPYHVWQVPQDVIDHAKGRQILPAIAKGKQKAFVPDRSQGEQYAECSSSAEDIFSRKRRCAGGIKCNGAATDCTLVPRMEKAGQSSMVPFERIQGLDFPRTEDLESIIPRFESIRSAARNIRHRVTGGEKATLLDSSGDLSAPAPALFAKEGHLHLLRLSSLQERSELDELVGELRQARTDLLNQYGQQWLQELDRVAPGVDAPTRSSFASPAPPPSGRQQGVCPAVAHDTSSGMQTWPGTARGASPERNGRTEVSPSSRRIAKSPATPTGGPGSRGPYRKKNRNPEKQHNPKQQQQQQRASQGLSASTPAPDSASAPIATTTTMPTIQPSVPFTASTTVTTPPLLPPSRPPLLMAPNRKPKASTSGAVTSPSTVEVPSAPVPRATSSGIAIPALAPNQPLAPRQPPVLIILPLSLINKLTSVGIAPLPAPHLQPAIEAHKRRAAAAAASGSAMPTLGDSSKNEAGGEFTTAPCEPDPNQTEAAILLGITEAEAPGGKGEWHQLVHLSLVLGKLNSSQLTALAEAVAMVQTQGGGSGTELQHGGVNGVPQTNGITTGSELRGGGAGVARSAAGVASSAPPQRSALPTGGEAALGVSSGVDNATAPPAFSDPLAPPDQH